MELLKGAPVAKQIEQSLKPRMDALPGKPTLALVRVGDKPDDVAYHRSIVKRCERIGVAYKEAILPGDVAEEDFLQTLRGLSTDDAVHGILLFRPLSKHLSLQQASDCILPRKDVDGLTRESYALVYSGEGGEETGFPPCTAQAVMEMLSYYQIPLRGRRAVVMGVSLVVGRPLAMMLLQKNATVTMCRSTTVEPERIASQADVLVAAIGKAKAIGADFIQPGAVVMDVGINVDEDGNLSGDVDAAGAEAGGASAYTPVPGGVGSVTTSLLLEHVVTAAERFYASHQC